LFSDKYKYYRINNEGEYLNSEGNVVNDKSKAEIIISINKPEKILDKDGNSIIIEISKTCDTSLIIKGKEKIEEFEKRIEGGIDA